MFAVFGCGVLWMTFKTVQTTLHDESINKMLVLMDSMRVRAAKFLQAGGMNSLQLLQQEAEADPNIAKNQ